MSPRTQRLLILLACGIRDGLLIFFVTSVFVLALLMGLTP